MSIPMLDENLIAELVERKVVSDTFRRLTTDKKNRIYRETITLFGEYGYDGLAVDKLCRMAGISKGSFFQYFPSKSHLLEFVLLVFDDYLGKWMAEIKKNEKAVLARDRLLYLYEALLVNSKLFKTEERFFLFVTSALNHSAVTIEGIDIERHLHNYVEEIIERGIQTGEIRGDVEVKLTTYLVSLIMSALVQKQYLGRRLYRGKLEEYFISFLFDGIKA